MNTDVQVRGNENWLPTDANSVMLPTIHFKMFEMIKFITYLIATNSLLLLLLKTKTTKSTKTHS